MSKEQNLVIVESPSKAKTINKYLGKDYKVIASVGHIIDLPKNNLGVDIDAGFVPDYVPMTDKSKVIKMLKAEANKASHILLATDPDREGEAIAYHISTLLKDKQKVSRIEFNEITKSAIQKALEHQREIDWKMVESQQARRVLDRIVGYKVSPILWKTISKGLSAGRVQSVALRLICEREAEVEKFVPVEYWNFFADFNTQHKEIYSGKLIEIEKEKVGLENYHIKNKEQAGKLKADINAQKDLTVLKIDIKQQLRKAPAPYITSSLQQDAISKLNMSARQVMRIAQQLYEGVELGGRGNFGLITYMRTDSTRVSNEALHFVRELIEKKYGKENLPAKPNFFGKKKKAQDAHEAVRPTYISEDFAPENIKKYLSRDQHRLYTLIWNRFVASQMKPARFEITTILTGNKKYVFETKGEKNTFKGFLTIYKIDKEENGDGGTNGNDKIPHKIEEKYPVELQQLNTSQEFTRPPARYTESSIVKKLDQLGIGRPSTYAQIITTLFDRLYIEKEEKKLIPTELGKIVSRLLVKIFPDLFNVKFTAMMEDELDKIEQATEQYINVMKKFYNPFSEDLTNIEKNLKEIKKELEEPTDETCEHCSSPMIIKWGRNGRFMACSNYPSCKNTRPLEIVEPDKTGEPCPKCGADLVKRQGKFGSFIACINYPECKYTHQIKLGVKCPKDGCKGDVTVLKSKRGKVFYGCSEYPKCNFVSWNKPVNKQCPECDNNYLEEKETKKSGKYYYCPSCKAKVPIS